MPGDTFSLDTAVGGVRSCNPLHAHSPANRSAFFPELVRGNREFQGNTLGFLVFSQADTVAEFFVRTLSVVSADERPGGQRIRCVSAQLFMQRGNQL